MDMEASTVARRAERPAEVRMIGLRAEPEPSMSASSTNIVANVVADGVGVGGGGRAEWASRVGAKCKVGH
jgi:hypothetical protein